MSTAAVDRIAGAPISWGVCEVPGWGYQLEPSRVLTEMRQIGLAATEFGPDGFLPATPEGKAQTLADHGLHGLGGFTPVVLYRDDIDPAPVVNQVLDGFAAVGAKVLVLSADSGMVGYDARPDLDSAGWATLLANLDRLVIRELESHGYDGWYVLEQDTILQAEPTGAGLVDAVEASATMSARCWPAAESDPAFVRSSYGMKASRAPSQGSCARHCSTADPTGTPQPRHTTPIVVGIPWPP